VELEGAVRKPKVPLRVPHRDQFYFLRTETCPHHRRQDGRAAPFASNKLGATASSNATRRRAQSCVSSYLRGCRFGFVGRGTDEHSQGEVGGAGSYNGATRATKPSYDVRSVRLRLGFCKYGLACAGICVLVHSQRSGAGAHVLCGPLWRCGSSRSYPCGFGRQRGGLEPATPSEVLWESRTSSWPAAFEGSHEPATARVERAAAARVSNCRSRRSMSQHGRGGARALVCARPSRGSRSCLVAFPRTHEAALGRAPARRRRRRGHTGRYCVRGLGGHDPEPHLLNIVT